MTFTLGNDVRRQAPAAVTYGNAAITRPASAAVDYGHRAVTALNSVLAGAALAATGRARILRVAVEIQPRQTVVVGQRITLDITNILGAAAVGALAATCTLKSVHWDIPGTVVKSYLSAFTETAPVRLTDADKGQPRIQFYWADGTDGRTVAADCVFRPALLNTDIHVTLYAVFDVKAPTLVYLGDSRHKSKHGQTRIGRSRGKEALEFTGEIVHGFIRDDGVVWDFAVRIPAGFDGYIKDLQTVYGITESTESVGGGRKLRRRLYKLPGRNLLRIPGPGPEEGCLVVDDYPGAHPDEPSPTYSIGVFNMGRTRTMPMFPAAVKGGETFRAKDIFDAPDQALEESWVHLTIHDAFKYFIMYKPKVPGVLTAIWVPVAKIEWFWKGEAVKTNGKWRLVEKAGGVTAKGAPTPEFPTYQDYHLIRVWEEAP